MNKLRILHLEDNEHDSLLVETELKKSGLEAQVARAKNGAEFLAALAREHPDVILSDSGVPGFSGMAALGIRQARFPSVPFIFVSSSASEREVAERLRAGASDHVSKEKLWQLIPALRRFNGAVNLEPMERHNHAMRRLVQAVQELSLAKDLGAIMTVVRRAARELTGADGATFVLRDGDKCHYADEDAIAPLWKGQRFPMSTCISGWVMLNKEPVAIEDIFSDSRIPSDAYRPTFVKSLVMVPIRPEAPIGAIGNYWATRHRASNEEVELLQALANTVSVAMENVQLYMDLERRVQERTAQLELANRDLEAFSYSVSHDLRAPLRAVSGFVGLLAEECHDALDDRAWEHITRVRAETARMARLIDDLLRLAKLSRAQLCRETVDLSALVSEIAGRYATVESGREVEFVVTNGLEVNGDASLLRAVLENLIGNAWKYTEKTERARVEFGQTGCEAGFITFFVKDNGAGFDMRYADKLFLPFQRLHSDEDFAGTGVGLATVQRIIH
ncbi:MAG TPA: GAF domain-containing protein, partial [Verrucomicrobiae bacterium]|nr:GAF domain-containing protein [Verrucomicrobiae bacterium]